MTGNKLEKITGDIVNEGYHLWASLNVWWTLNREHKNYLKIINHKDYGAFFSAVRFACNRNIYLSIGKIFDRDTRTSSLKNLKIELEGDMKPDLAKLIDNLLCDEGVIKTLNRLKQVRNQYVAHNQTQPTDKGSRTWDETIDLIKKTCKVINQVADGISFDENKRIPNIIDANTYKMATQQVLNALRSSENG